MKSFFPNSITRLLWEKLKTHVKKQKQIRRNFKDKSISPPELMSGNPIKKYVELWSANEPTIIK